MRWAIEKCDNETSPITCATDEEIYEYGRENIIVV
jgi:hypothetical protein